MLKLKHRHSNISLLLLRSNAGMVMSELEVEVLAELGISLKFLLGSPQLVPEVSPRWPQAYFFECVGWTGLQDVLWVLNTSFTWANIISL